MMMMFEQAARKLYRWRKARSSISNGACVEVAPVEGGGVAIRNSNNPQGAVLIYTAAEWSAFLDGAKKGEFDDLVEVDGRRPS